MDIVEHKKQFEKIVKKYNLLNEEKAKEISTFLTKNKENKIDVKQFSILFNISIDDAKIFLSFINKGLEFKEKHIDKK